MRRSKGGKMLGGKPPRRGGRLTGPAPRGQRRGERQRTLPPQLLPMVVLGCLVLGTVGGFAFAMDRQLTAGVISQAAEAAQRPDWAPLDALPAYVPAAFLVAVDPNFLRGGALRARDERGTTVPRELVRQIHRLGSGLGSSARELVMAPVLEQRVAKDELLELYLNRVYLGEAQDYPVYGIHHAAREYIGKEPEALTLGETAALAGLLLEPRIRYPEEQAGAVGIRRNEVLRALLGAGTITPSEYQAAIAERLPFQPGLDELPMSRRLPGPADSAVIRLPQEYLAQPEPADSAAASAASASG